MSEQELNTTNSPAEIEVRDAAKREIVVRVVPWDIVAESQAGLETWQRGALAHVNPSDVVIRHEHDGTPTGRGIELEERDDGAYMAFRVSKTARGDEQLELARDGVIRGVSGSWPRATEVVEMQQRQGRRVRVVKRADLVEVSTVWRPTWEQSAVLAVRSKEPQGEPVAENAQPVAPDNAIVAAIEALGSRMPTQDTEFQERLMGRLEQLEERSRREIVVPMPAPKREVAMADWAHYALRTLSGDPLPAKFLHERDLEDIVTQDNPGLVPDAFINDLLGFINEGRPFMASTRQIVAPDSGMSIIVPVLTQRSTVAVQSAEKTDIDSTAMIVSTRTFDAVTIAGGADVSIQLIRRANRSFIDLLLADLRSAYARESDSQALATLFAAGTTPGTANIDPEDLQIGEAWTNSIAATGLAPDTLWLSGAGVAAFINAQNDGTNAPLYFTLNANFSVGGGPGGNVSALRPVYVPAMDGTSVDVMIGPSSGFAWAEDGAITLSADVPSRAGRDIALVGIQWYIPRYAAAFTTYDLGS